MSDAHDANMTAIQARLVTLDLVITQLLETVASGQADKNQALRIWFDRLSRSLSAYPLAELPAPAQEAVRNTAKLHLSALFGAVADRERAMVAAAAGPAAMRAQGTPGGPKRRLN